MYGSAVSKDLNLPAVQPQMSSPGLLLRYRSAPINNLFGEDFHAAEGGAAGHHHAADAALARFLAGSHDDNVDCKPPRPTAPAHFLHDAASMDSQHQLMYQSPPPQQQMGSQMEGHYRNLSSGDSEHDAVGSGNSLVRQSSSPAGFLNHLNMDNGYGNVVRVGGDVRLKRQLSYSSRQGQGSVMPQISELGGGGNPEVGVPAGAGYAMDGGSSGWDDASPTPDQSHHLSGSKRSRDPAHAPPVPDGHHLAPQLSLPSGGGGNGKTIEKLLQFQDAVPCKIRAKRGCATHPRSIAERVRRTRISERIRKLQELVPNMEKQTNTADMLDLAVNYAKDLQKQIKELNDSRANCTCAASKQFAC